MTGATRGLAIAAQWLTRLMIQCSQDAAFGGKIAGFKNGAAVFGLEVIITQRYFLFYSISNYQISRLRLIIIKLGSALGAHSKEVL